MLLAASLLTLCLFKILPVLLRFAPDKSSAGSCATRPRAFRNITLCTTCLLEAAGTICRVRRKHATLNRTWFQKCTEAAFGEAGAVFFFFFLHPHYRDSCSIKTQGQLQGSGHDSVFCCSIKQITGVNYKCQSCAFFFFNIAAR